MAVYTHLSADDLAALLAEYDLGALSACDPVAEGIENTNYVLTTAQGRFILTLFERRVAEADLPFFIGVMAHLAAHDFPAPKPIARRDGLFFSRAKDRPAVIVSFLDGVWPRQTTLQHCAAIGDTLARMHVALAEFEQTRANTLGPPGWEALLASRLDDAEKLRSGLGPTIARDIEAVRIAWPSGLPRGAIHADLFPDNALFAGDRLSGVIDFYFACTDFLAYDLAVCLNAWCFKNERTWSAERGRAMIAAYESVRPLSGDERNALPLLARGAALRFFATRLTDWSAQRPGALVKPKDPLEYADKLAFWRDANLPTSTQ
ncbi:homoserine kinase [Terricaulis sp.]|uniref:homoserine kinase n=1 Tax=Terricaulis sp. TaxID=2768686 RepID=UPI003784A83A